ncbi:MAG: hypothetical protein PHR83_00200 [Paludibacter sp.]|nr:hypothetical protein [Paludibacter sp.]
MNKTVTHTHSSRFALLLLAVFMSSLLSKPVHNLLSRHTISEGIITIPGEYDVTTDHYKGCPICDFEFCTFIPQEQINIPQTAEIFYKVQSSKAIDAPVYQSVRLFSLRAPPTL